MCLLDAWSTPSKRRLSLQAWLSRLLTTFWRQLTSTALACIFGKSVLVQWLYFMHYWHYRANRAQYAEVSFHSVGDDEIAEVALPSMQGTAEEEGRCFSLCLMSIGWFATRVAALQALSDLTAEDAPVDVFSTPPQLDGELITLTLLPRSRWQTLLNIEVIQVLFSNYPHSSKSNVHTLTATQQTQRTTQSSWESSILFAYSTWCRDTLCASTEGKRKGEEEHAKIRQDVCGDGEYILPKTRGGRRTRRLYVKIRALAHLTYACSFPRRNFLQLRQNSIPSRDRLRAEISRIRGQSQTVPQCPNTTSSLASRLRSSGNVSKCVFEDACWCYGRKSGAAIKFGKDVAGAEKRDRAGTGTDCIVDRDIRFCEGHFVMGNIPINGVLKYEIKMLKGDSLEWILLLVKSFFLWVRLRVPVTWRKARRGVQLP